jgi:hypothetical protein
MHEFILHMFRYVIHTVFMPSKQPGPQTGKPSSEKFRFVEFLTHKISEFLQCFTISLCHLFGNYTILNMLSPSVQCTYCTHIYGKGIIILLCLYHDVYVYPSMAQSCVLPYIPRSPPVRKSTNGRAARNCCMRV